MDEGANEDTYTTRKSIVTYANSVKLHDALHTEGGVPRFTVLRY